MSLAGLPKVRLLASAVLSVSLTITLLYILLLPRAPLYIDIICLRPLLCTPHKQRIIKARPYFAFSSDLSLDISNLTRKPNVWSQILHQESLHLLMTTI